MTLGFGYQNFSLKNRPTVFCNHPVRKPITNGKITASPTADPIIRTK
jgi:hypothetical protein